MRLRCRCCRNFSVIRCKMMSSSSPRCHFSRRSDDRQSAGTFPSRSPLMFRSARRRHASLKTGVSRHYGARQVIAAGTRPIDASHRGGPPPATEAAHGPVDASSVGLRCISESAAELLDRVGFPSCRLYPFAQQAVHVRCRSD